MLSKCLTVPVSTCFAPSSRQKLEVAQGWPPHCLIQIHGIFSLWINPSMKKKSWMPDMSRIMEARFYRLTWTCPLTADHSCLHSAGVSAHPCEYKDGPGLPLLEWRLHDYTSTSTRDIEKVVSGCSKKRGNYPVNKMFFHCTYLIKIYWCS
jgi:hypothetical protein